MKKRIWDYISAILVILNGVICIFYYEEVYKLVPTICSLVLLLKGIIMMIKSIKEKDYTSLEGKKFERSIILIAIAIGIFIRQNDAIFIVGVFWGLSGLNKAANYLNEALYYFYKKEKYILIFIKSIVEFVLSFILIFDPFSKIVEHLAILGLELVLEGTLELVSLNKGKEEELEEL